MLKNSVTCLLQTLFMHQHDHCKWDSVYNISKRNHKMCPHIWSQTSWKTNVSSRGSRTCWTGDSGHYCVPSVGNLQIHLNVSAHTYRQMSASSKWCKLHEKHKSYTHIHEYYMSLWTISVWTSNNNVSVKHVSWSGYNQMSQKKHKCVQQRF